MKFAVENFKIFKERQEFDIRPITILVGPNGSGKSSVIRALELMRHSKLTGNSTLDVDLSKFGTKSSGNFKDYLPKSSTNLESFTIEILEWDFKYINNQTGVEEIALDQSEMFGHIRMLLEFAPKTNKNNSKIVARKITLISLLTNEILFIQNVDQQGIYTISIYWESLLKLKLLKSSKWPNVNSEFVKKKGRFIPMFKNSQFAFDPSKNFLKISNPSDFEWDTKGLLKDNLALCKVLFATQDFEVGKGDWNIDELAKYAIKQHYTKSQKGEEFPYIYSNLAKIDISFSQDTNGKSANSFFEQPRQYFQTLESFQNLFSQSEFITTNRAIRNEIIMCSENIGFRNELERILNLYKLEFPSIRKVMLDKVISSFRLLGLADDIEILFDESQISASISLVKNGQKVALQDCGYGLINLFTMILGLFPKKQYTWDAGNEKLICIEEPEMNLHPNAQSKLADILIQMLDFERQNTLVLETHSEYLIRRFQYLVAKGELKKEDIQIYYFNNSENLQPGDEVVYPININADGSLTRPFGPGFFDEAANLNLLLYNKTNESLN